MKEWKNSSFKFLLCRKAMMVSSAMLLDPKYWDSGSCWFATCSEKGSSMCSSGKIASLYTMCWAFTSIDALSYLATLRANLSRYSSSWIAKEMCTSWYGQTVRAWNSLEVCHFQTDVCHVELQLWFPVSNSNISLHIQVCMCARHIWEINYKMPNCSVNKAAMVSVCDNV